MKFRGEYAFLSNMTSSRVTVDDKEYPTIEHAFQASKTTNKEEREQVRRAETPIEAKRIGRKITLRKDWHEVKDQIMYELCKQKFNKEPFKSMLIKVTEPIIEENTWGDRYWGICNGTGLNKLGCIISKIKEELEQNQSL
jgi:hypothetical protein